MKRFKKLGIALLSATLLLIPCMTSINAQDNPYDTWKTTALKSPSKGQLVAAGDIKISWNSLEKVQHYDIYFDGKYEKSVEANITQTTIYSTAVARHTIRVVAVLENNDEIKEFEGLVKERTTVSVTDGDKSVISTFLVKSDKKQESQTTAEKETQTASDGKLYDVYTLSPVLVKEYGDGWHNIGGNRYYYRGSQRVTGWQNIDGLQYYFDGNGKLSSCTMIDVSTYNGDIDWNAVKAAGVDYAIIRVGYRGYGTARLVQDRRFEQNMRGAINAGIRVGAYIVTQAVNTEEAVELYSRKMPWIQCDTSTCN